MVRLRFVDRRDDLVKSEICIELSGIKGEKSKKGSGSGGRSVESSNLISKKVQHRGAHTAIRNRADLEKLYRLQRARGLSWFRYNYHFGAVNSNDQGSTRSCQYERRRLIWPRGYECWLEPSSGITWVAVCREGLICVVTKNQDLDEGRIDPSFSCFSDKEIRVAYMRTIVHQMEDPSSELHQRFNQCVKRRSFAAVSASLVPDGVPEESGDQGLLAVSGEEEATSFLQKKIKSGPAFTYEEIVQTAISALERVHQEEFEATDILVSIWKKGDQYDKELQSEHVEKHLSVIHQQPAGSTSTWCRRN